MALSATQKLKIKTLLGYTHTDVDIDVRLADVDATEQTLIETALTNIADLDLLITTVSAPSSFAGETPDLKANPALALGLLHRHTWTHINSIAMVLGWPIKQSIYSRGPRGLS